MAFAGMMAFGCSTCCPNCTIASDTFSTDTIASYSTTGSPTITGGELVLNANDGVAHNTAAASEDDATRVTFTIDTAETNATIRAILAWSDWSNYLYGEIEKTGSTWTILVGRRIGGSDEEYTTAVEITAPTLPATACLSWHPGETQTPEAFVISGTMPSEVEDTGGGGGGAWSNITRVLVNDGSEAQFAFPSSGTTEDTDTLLVRWLGLGVPAGSTIDEVRVTIQATGGGVLWTVIDKDAILSSGLSTFADKATGVAFGTAEERTYTWTDVTWEDIPTLAFTMVFQRSTAFTGGSVTVDYLGELEILFTTPERTPGRLRLLVGECVSEYSAESPAGGLKAGVRSQAGDWDVDSFDYKYAQSAARPTCEDCDCSGGGANDAEPCGCCDQDFPPAERYTVTVSSPLNNAGCNSCTDIDGTYELTPNGSCAWFYYEELNCTYSPCTDNGPSRFAIHAHLDLDCRWVVTMHVGSQGVGSGSPCGTNLGYVAAAPIATNEDCQTGPVTLDRAYQLASHTGEMCTADGPLTITLDVA